MERADWVSAISVYGGERFNQPRIPDRKQRGLGHNSQIKKAERGANRDRTDQIPNAQVHARSIGLRLRCVVPDRLVRCVAASGVLARARTRFEFGEHLVGVFVSVVFRVPYVGGEHLDLALG